MEFDVNFQLLIDILKNFFEFVKNEVFNSEFTGFVMHLFSYFPVEIRNFFLVSLVISLFFILVLRFRD